MRARFAFLLVLLAGAPPLRADSIAVRATPVPLDPSRPEHQEVGRLRYRGGLHLVSDDPRFGGLSSIRVLPDGERLAAVSDEGWWLSARLVHAGGRLVGVAGVELGALLGSDGRALQGKDARDAEALALEPDGSFVVAFERRHRLLRYPAGSGRPDGVPVAVAAPPGLAQAPFNGGVESLVALRDGTLFALTEDWLDGELVVGWFDGPASWKRLGLRVEGALRPSDGAPLPSGDLLLLERAYTPERGITSVRVRQVAGSALRASAALGGRLVAELVPPLTLDNYEGLATSRGPRGETLVYVASDDNFNAAAGQRTLLLMFELRR